MAKVSVICVGIEPGLIDFNDAAYAAFPGMTAQKVQAGLDRDITLLNDAGYEAQLCLVDFGQTAEQILRDCIARKHPDCIMFGAGVRLVAQNTPLFERLLNVAHAQAPHAKLCFNTGPTDSAAAVQRWFKASD